MKDTYKKLTAKYKIPAFTLAEVLITLGIIGVVAALTLPTLITSYREKQRVSQLKKTYSALQQAFTMAQEKHGEYQYWELTKTSNGERDENGELVLDYSGADKVLAYLGENLSTKTNNSTFSFAMYDLTGKLLGTYQRPSNRYLLLNDGTILLIGWVNPSNTDVMVYFPGCERKGCRLGIDIFYMKLLPKYGFIPTGIPDDGNRLDSTGDVDNTKFSNTTCNINKPTASATNGRGCTAWVIYKENMDYLHCDDLSWNDKNKCR